MRWLIALGRASRFIWVRIRLRISALRGSAYGLGLVGEGSTNPSSWRMIRPTRLCPSAPAPLTLPVTNEPRTDHGTSTSAKPSRTNAIGRTDARTVDPTAFAQLGVG